MCKYCDMIVDYKTRAMCYLPECEKALIKIIDGKFYIEVSVNCNEYCELIPIEYCPKCGEKLDIE